MSYIRTPEGILSVGLLIGLVLRLVGTSYGWSEIQLAGEITMSAAVLQFIISGIVFLWRNGQPKE